MLDCSGMMLNYFFIFYMLYLGICLFLINNDLCFYSCDLFNFDNCWMILFYKKKNFFVRLLFLIFKYLNIMFLLVKRFIYE